MTVKEFALAAYEPKEFDVCIGYESYNLISENTGKIDHILMSLIGDYVIEEFKSREPDKYIIWVQAAPVRKGGAS